MKISIIIPCFNEIDTIENIVDKVLKQTQFEKEIIIVDDFSTDGTREVLEHKVKNKIDHLILNEKNYGKGFCVREGISKSNGNIILIQDADLEYDPSDYSKLIDPIKKGYADVVFGSRFVGSDEKLDSKMWTDMGYTTGNGRDMTSVMYRMDGPPIHEQTLGSADAMLLRLLDGDESMGGTKSPYDPRIHFVLIRNAYLDANPGDTNLRNWLDSALAQFDDIYSGSRPGFLEGYKALKEVIVPWGT